MSFIPGKQYPVAFLIFDCFNVPGNYLNHARSSVQKCFARIDPVFNDNSEILSGDLLPNATKSLYKIMQDSIFPVDMSRLDTNISKKLKSGKWPGEYYIIGILFVVPQGVDMIHSEILDAEIEGYKGLFTVTFTAGTQDISELSMAFRVSNARIGDRV